jgi:hypothetical protein
VFNIHFSDWRVSFRVRKQSFKIDEKIKKKIKNIFPNRKKPINSKKEKKKKIYF